MTPDDQLRHPRPGDIRLDAAAGGFDFGEFGHGSKEDVTGDRQHMAGAAA